MHFEQRPGKEKKNFDKIIIIYMVPIGTNGMISWNPVFFLLYSSPFCFNLIFEVVRLFLPQIPTVKEKII